MSEPKTDDLNQSGRQEGESYISPDEETRYRAEIDRLLEVIRDLEIEIAYRDLTISYCKVNDPGLVADAIATTNKIREDNKRLDRLKNQNKKDFSKE
jgi:hypothetical protein